VIKLVDFSKYSLDSEIIVQEENKVENLSFGNICDDSKNDTNTTPKVSRKRKLKTELRQIIHCFRNGHKLYTQLGFNNIMEAEARVQEIIDML